MVFLFFSDQCSCTTFIFTFPNVRFVVSFDENKTSIKPKLGDVFCSMNDFNAVYFLLIACQPIQSICLPKILLLIVLTSLCAVKSLFKPLLDPRIPTVTLHPLRQCLFPSYPYSYRIFSTRTELYFLTFR